MKILKNNLTTKLINLYQVWFHKHPLFHLDPSQGSHCCLIPLSRPRSQLGHRYSGERHLNITTITIIIIILIAIVIIFPWWNAFLQNKVASECVQRADFCLVCAHACMHTCMNFRWASTVFLPPSPFSPQDQKEERLIGGVRYSKLLQPPCGSIGDLETWPGQITFCWALIGPSRKITCQPRTLPSPPTWLISLQVCRGAAARKKRPGHQQQRRRQQATNPSHFENLGLSFASQHFFSVSPGT